MRRIIGTAAAVAAATALIACASESKTRRVQVTATDTTCQPAASSLGAGKTTFAVKNEGKDVTELYVLQGTKTVGEVENITPGSTRNLTVTLKQGTYDLNCKPGMKGDGIRTAITVTGSAGSGSGSGASEGTPAATVSVSARDYTFDGLAQFHAKKGSTVEFSMTNNGPAKHEMEIIAPDGKVIGEVAPIDAGKVGSTEVKFKKAGTYTYQCDFADHVSRGMKGTFEVS